MHFLIIVMIFALLTGCAQNPVSGQSDFVLMSEGQELAIGRQNDVEIKKQYHVYESKALQDYVNGIGQRLAKQSHRPNLRYHFTVLDSPEINAFALPGGYVYVTRGILAYLNSEAELAAVLGHELGHVTARHGVRQQSVAQAANIGLTIASIFVPQLNSPIAGNAVNLAGGALLSGYGREHELEADRLGAIYLARSAYDPQAIIKILRVLKNQELKDIELAKQEGREPRRYSGLFDTHPDNDTRLKEVVGEAGKQTVANPIERRDEFLKIIEGLVFNDNSDQGVVRNNRFYHTDLGMVLQFPEAWQVHNLPDAVVAISPRGEARMQMQTGGKAEGTPLEYAQRLAGFDARTQATEIKGLPAALIESPDSIGWVIFLNKQVFILQAKGKTKQDLDAHRGEISGAAHSFHAMTAEESKLVKPLTIHVIPVRAGDTYASLARNSPLGKSAESYLRLINAQYPKGEPQLGQRIKIVE